MTDNEEDIPSMGEAVSNQLTRYAPSECDNECHNCGYDFDKDEWDYRHLHGGASVGESWIYTCPQCEEETVAIDT